uniref:50S ribosomal protein L18, chloroplastic n=1 Tax=Octactis speculum TaxID=3111310 RepID=A0A7S2G6E0_9STRA|mmetsp:Transcript_39987/g.54461  ORF Transcript_39987/g.54461 Transcript_39987/m.54461 type:complete len:156 (+) Transcript_39987:38-505(+)|eukprot:CAMPEP_0185743788 /NCGR_PEP_ID=MMETSP1174-20130828/1690_1 /TAXON_ID=35687 /ORGANISM="Dictyocha speculum, Strain CCMP1381" /LENGTH=155 /DNA_ID=CAMNT_0028416755 /DNA_START=38 /DNA_END=505 /DNA_ORIENTATION=+
MMLLRFSMLALSLVTTSAFSVSHVHARHGTITMATKHKGVGRNPFKAMKLRTKRVANNGNGRFRLTIFRSNEHIYAQVINDIEGRTLLAVNSKNLNINGSNKEGAKTVGQALGEAAKEKGLDKLFYDRESANHKYMYHGRIEALVEGIREKEIAI